VSREIPVTPDLVGTPASDYRVARVDVEPPRLSITGGQSQVQKVRQLVTEPLDIGGADATVERQLAVLRPDAEVTFTGTNRGEFPRVKVSVGLEPMVSKRGVEVPIFDAAQWGGAVASSYSVELGGPAPTLRHLDQLGLAEPVAAQVKEIRDPDAPSQKAVEIRFGWTSAVPPDVREGLSIVPSAVRVPLPSAAAKSPEPLPR
jgi:hypothetical protein